MLRLVVFPFDKIIIYHLKTNVNCFFHFFEKTFLGGQSYAEIYALANKTSKAILSRTKYYRLKYLTLNCYSLTIFPRFIHCVTKNMLNKIVTTIKPKCFNQFFTRRSIHELYMLCKSFCV